MSHGKVFNEEATSFELSMAELSQEELKAPDDVYSGTALTLLDSAWPGWHPLATMRAT